MLIDRLQVENNFSCWQVVLLIIFPTRLQKKRSMDGTELMETISTNLKDPEHHSMPELTEGWPLAVKTSW